MENILVYTSPGPTGAGGERRDHILQRTYEELKI